jgi:serine/threonine-protein kinase
VTKVGAVIGTPEYMSPEQALGQPVDGRSDLYSVGIILFEMLTGRSPFSGEAVTVLRQHVLSDVPELPPDIARDVDPRLVVILRRLLAKLPADRIASAAELMASLDACSTEGEAPEEPIATRPSVPSVAGMATPAGHRVQRSLVLLRYATKRRLVIMAGGGAAAMMIILALAAGSKTQEAPATTTPPLADSAPVVIPTSSPPVASALPLPPRPAPSTSAIVPARQPGRRNVGKPAAPGTASTSRSSGFLPTPAASTTADPCTPPYRLDFFGNKVPKPGCS